MPQSSNPTSVLNTAPDARAELFGGKGVVKVWNLMRQAADPFTAVLWCELEAGGSVGAHRQEAFAEIVVGVEGEGEATVDGHASPLGPGDMVHLPLGSVLSLRCTGEQPLRYLIIKARG